MKAACCMMFLARFMEGHLHEKLTKYPPTELISQLDDIMTSVCDEYITGKKIAVTDSGLRSVGS